LQDGQGLTKELRASFQLMLEAGYDNRRELPCATGIIDVGAFLNALNQIGYDGPVRAEPFNQAVNRMTKDEACAAAAAALEKAFALIH
jgi:sugar phosphate isomerase/epimerase